MKQAKRVVKEMMVGLVIWLLLVFLVLIIAAEDKLSAAAGVLLGGLTAAGLLIHMYRHLDIALDMDLKRARSHAQMASLQRVGIIAAVLLVSIAGYPYVHPLGTALGIFGMKIAAYLQPVVHKYFKCSGGNHNR